MAEQERERELESLWATWDMDPQQYDETESEHAARYHECLELEKGINSRYEKKNAAKIKAARVREMIELSEDDLGLLHPIVSAITASGGAEIVVDDSDPENFDDELDKLWVVSERQLKLNGITLAEWSRCSAGAYREGIWNVSEDTEGGDEIPDYIKNLLEALDIEDEDLPNVPEPDEPDTVTEDSAHAAVWYHGLTDDWTLQGYYASAKEAEFVADQHTATFHRVNGDDAYGHEWVVTTLSYEGIWTTPDEASSGERA